jgi:hypothetical protein
MARIVDSIAPIRSLNRTNTFSTLTICSSNQGLTLVHFSAQPEPFLKQNITLHTP